MTDEELDREWAILKEAEAKRAAKWLARPKEERERIEKEIEENRGFYERISENPFGDDDDL